jgi:hypothetical protein
MVFQFVCEYLTAITAVRCDKHPVLLNGAKPPIFSDAIDLADVEAVAVFAKAYSLSVGQLNIDLARVR